MGAGAGAPNAPVGAGAGAPNAPNPPPKGPDCVGAAGCAPKPPNVGCDCCCCCAPKPPKAGGAELPKGAAGGGDPKGVEEAVAPNGEFVDWPNIFECFKFR